MRNQKLFDILRGYANERRLSDDALAVSFSVFSSDLDLVHTTGEVPVGLLDRPLPHGRYTLTQLREGPGDIRQAISNRFCLFVTCMDRRGAQLGYQAAVKKARKRQINKVIVLAIGGGIAQDGVRLRELALRIIIRWLAENGQLEMIIATGHDRGCGYIAYVEGQKLFDKLGCEPGSVREQTSMLTKIRDGVRMSISRNLRAKTYVALAHFGSNERFTYFVNI